MTKEERDNILLTELCLECSLWDKMSEWSKFGFVWELAQKTEWWSTFWNHQLKKFTLIHGNSRERVADWANYLWQEIITTDFQRSLINPEHLLDALAEFLMQRKEKI